MNIKYGAQNKYIDITQLFKDEETILIPACDDVRSILFGDPIFKVEKHILITDDFDRQMMFVSEMGVLFSKSPDGVYDLTYVTHDVQRERDFVFHHPALTPVAKLAYLHTNLIINYGTMSEEYVEQVMAMMWIPRDAHVLELGGNIGRNSCVIGNILTDSSHLVTMECDPVSAAHLKENRDFNNLHFFVETAALSKQKLIQRFWNTKPWDGVSPIENGWSPVSTMSWSDVQLKHSSLKFDTLVADCEGALYYILQDEPDFFKNFKRVLVENDYLEESHKAFVDEKLREAGMGVVFSEPLPSTDPNFSKFPKVCSSKFYETWSV